MNSLNISSLAVKLFKSIKPQQFIAARSLNTQHFRTAQLSSYVTPQIHLTPSKDLLKAHLHIASPLSIFFKEKKPLESTLSVKKDESWNPIFTDAQLSTARELNVPPSECNQHGVFINRSPEIQKVILRSINENVSLEEVTPSMLKEIVRLYSSNQQIERLDKHDLSGLTELRLLDLTCNKIKEIPKDFFKYTPYLERIHMDDNKLTELNKHSLAHTNNLEVATISNNLIQLISSKTFNMSPKLELINLSFNQIGFIPKDVLKYQDKLEILNLAYNYLKIIPAEIFENKRVLVWLFLQSNHIETLPEELRNNCKIIQKITLDSNPVKYLPENLKEIPELHLNNTPIYKENRHNHLKGFYPPYK